MRETGEGVTYAEVRQWAVYLKTFTASDLASSMRTTQEVGERGVKALLWHGICRDTGDWIPGPDGEPEPLIEYIPPVYRIYNREKVPPPERVVGYTEVPVRGLPINLSKRGARTSQVGSRRPGRVNGQKPSGAL